MTIFAVPTRFDDTVADEGVWFEMYTEASGHYGDFQCGLIDKHTQRWKLVLARLEKELALKRRRGEKSDNFTARMFVEISLMNWRGIKDENGDEVPYDKQEAIEYFSLPETAYLLEQLWNLAADVTNFQPIEEEEDADQDAIVSPEASKSGASAVPAEKVAKKAVAPGAKVDESKLVSGSKKFKSVNQQEAAE